MILVWAGPSKPPPVGDAQVAAWTKGAGTNAFSALASQLATKHGTPLRGALAERGIDPDTPEPIALGAWSAGGALVDAILANPLDQGRVRAVGLFDATYCPKGAPAKVGILWAAQEAAADRLAMIATTSHLSGNYDLGLPTSTECFRTYADDDQVRAQPIPCPSIGPAECEAGRGSGNLRWWVYKNRANPEQTHIQHATVLAPAFMPGLMATTSEPGSPGPWKPITPRPKPRVKPRQPKPHQPPDPQPKPKKSKAGELLACIAAWWLLKED